MQEEWDKAITDCDKAISLNADYAYAYYNRAIAKEMKRDLKGACADWEVAGNLGLEASRSFYSSSCK